MKRKIDKGRFPLRFKEVICLLSILALSTPAAFSATFQVKKQVVIGGSGFVRLADIVHLFATDTPGIARGGLREGRDFVSLEPIAGALSPRDVREFAFRLTREKLREFRVLRYRAAHVQGARLQIFLGSAAASPRRLVFDEVLSIPGEKDMVLDLDEINFRVIEMGRFPITRVVFRIWPNDGSGPPSGMVSQVRLEKGLSARPGRMQIKALRLEGRIQETIVVPPRSEIVFSVRSREVWKLEGFLGYPEGRDAGYGIFVDGEPIQGRLAGDRGWIYFRDYFPGSAAKDKESVVRLVCSGDAPGFFANVMLSPQGGAGPAPKRIVLYLVDALRGDLGGIPFANLSMAAIFREGTFFPRAYVNATQTSDTLPVIFTGKYKFLLTGMGHERPLVGDSEETLPMFLKKRGFVTAAFLANPWLIFSNSHRGFDYVYTIWNARQDELTNVSGRLPLPMDEETHRFIKKGDLLREIDLFLERNREKPFFIYVHTLETHTPFALPPWKLAHAKGRDPQLMRSVFPNEPDFWKFLQAPRPEQLECIRDLYRDNVLDADRQLRKTYLLFTKRRLDENLLLILTADHGERLFEHRAWGHGGPDMYNEVLHVPLVMNFPRRSLASCTAAAQSIDLFPTIADWATGAADAKRFLGRSLLRCPSGEAGEAGWIFSEGWKHSMFSFISGPRKLIFSDGQAVAFRLDEDPLEQKALAPEDAGFSADEIRRMRGFRKNIGAKSRRAERPSGRALSEEDMRRLKSLGYFNDPD
ncbi:MAG: sulfatase-like hydrolase/transferase [Candidatus Aminicenantes bacterium]|nr:sulfatase-like hydrolase/transferase [Candidatus Aminicenantes bacterium]